MNSHGNRVVHIIGMGKYPPTISFHVTGGKQRSFDHPTMRSHARLTRVINHLALQQECSIFTFVSGWSAFERGALVSPP